MEIITYQGTVYEVEEDNPYPHRLWIDGISHGMRSALCRGIALIRIREKLEDNTITYTNMTRTQVRGYFFGGVIPDSELDKVMPLMGDM